jgi:magnesium-protoporphyrin IX monomethyl ester (oxidative) cyclase
MILLINPKTTKSTENQTEFFREPNLGILYLAGILDNHHIPVEILDLEQYNHLEENEIKEIIISAAEPYDIIGITCLTNTYYLAVEIAKIIKTTLNNKFIVFGGPHVSFLYEEILKEYGEIDFICVGEAENSLLALVLLLKNYLNENLPIDEVDLSLNRIKGIAYKNRHNKIVFTGLSEIVDIEKIPNPARYLLSNVNFYYRVANVIINRGCPNQCSFCSRQNLFKKIRIRSLASILSEIRDIIALQNYNYINFYDNINIDQHFFQDFCRLFIDNDIQIPWGCELRVDNISSEDARLLKKAGCQLIATGIESASLEVLRNNMKYQTPKHVITGIKNLKNEKIPIQAYFVLGLPGETNNTFQETLSFIKKLPLDSQDTINYFIATPYPGSKLWENQSAFNIKILEKDFSKYDCQHIIFETGDLDFSSLKKLYRAATKIETYFEKN